MLPARDGVVLVDVAPDARFGLDDGSRARHAVPHSEMAISMVDAAHYADLTRATALPLGLDVTVRPCARVRTRRACPELVDERDRSSAVALDRALIEAGFDALVSELSINSTC